MEQLSPKTAPQATTWTLIRDIAVLQVKLIVDGLRDFVLVPASLIAGMISLVNRKDGRPGPEFYSLVNVGKQSERWINLFGAMRNAPPEVAEHEHFGNAELDDLVSRVESFVVDEYQRGGVTAKGRDRIHEAMAKMRRGQSPFREKGSDPN
jgi:hypothetical protein